MTHKIVTGSTLLSLLFLSGNVCAEVSPEQLRNELLGSESRLQQVITQGDYPVILYENAETKKIA